MFIPTNNFWVPEPVFMKLGMCIMATELMSMAEFVNPISNADITATQIHAVLIVMLLKCMMELGTYIMPAEPIL
jgi:hypothetical protein